MRFLLVLLLLSGCDRALPEIRDLGEFQIELTAATPQAAVRGEGCFRVTGTALDTATRARVGGVEAESVTPVDSDLDVCLAANTPIGAQTLEVGTSDELATLPSQVTVVDALEPGQMEPPSLRVAWGGVLTITGRGWDTVEASNHIVTFAGQDGRIVGEVTQSSADQISVVVPDTAVSGPVEVALSSVDPPGAPAALDPVTVIQGFGFEVVPIRPEGAFAGEVIQLQVLSTASGGGSLPADEIAVDAFQVSIDSLPAEAYVSPEDPSRIVVRLPSDLTVGESEICVQGDVDQPCTLEGLEILGPGHTDMLRPPACTSLNPTNGVTAVTTPYPMRFHEPPERVINWVFALSNEANAIFQISTNDSKASKVLPLPIPPPNGQYQGLVANMGCANTGEDDCVPDVGATGWISTVQVRPGEWDRLVQYGFGDDGFARETALVGVTSVERMLPLDATRVGLVARHSGTSRVTTKAVLGLVQSWVDLGGTLIDMVPIERPGPADAPEWLQYVAAIDAGGTTHIVHVDFTGAAPAVSPAVVSPVQLQGNISWIEGEEALVAFHGGDARLVLLEGSAPSWTGVRGVVELVAEDVCGGGSCAVDPDPRATTAVSRPTTFDGRPGHWIVHSSHHAGRATAVAFVPLFGDPFWDVPPATLTLPRWSFGGAVEGAIIYDAPLGTWWLAENINPALPRHALVQSDATVGRLTLPYRDDVAGVPHPPRYQNLLAGDDVPTVWGAGHGATWSAFHRDGYLAHIDTLEGTVAPSPLPLIEDAEVVVWPIRDHFGLQVAHGYQPDTRAQILLDNTGAQISGFGMVARGNTTVDANGVEVSVESIGGTLKVTAAETPAAIAAGSYQHSLLSDYIQNWANAVVGYTCQSDDPRTISGDGRMVAEACELDSGSCPDLADCAGCTGGAPRRILLWSTDLTVDTEWMVGVETDLCAPGARVLAVLPRPDTNESLVLWTVDGLTGGSTSSFTFASLISVTGFTAENLTGERVGESGRTESIVAPAAASELIGWRYSRRFDRWAFALNFGGSGTAVSNVSAENMAVQAMPIPAESGVAAFLGSPDGVRSYALVSNDFTSEVLIFRNGMVPELMGVTQLPSAATSLAISRAGGTLVAGVGDGYCVISD